MIKPFPPRRPRGSWWVALAVALGVLMPNVMTARAQDDTETKKDGSSSAQDKDKKEAAREDAEEKSKTLAAAEKEVTPDRWEDPRAEAALKNTFPVLSPVTLPAADKTLVEQLSKGQGQIDRDAIKRYVRSHAANLTNRAAIAALMDPAGDPKVAKTLETATTELIKPLLLPPNEGNAAFRKIYVSTLIDVLKPVLNGNLHSRTMAMIVLSRSADTQAIPVFVNQLNDPNQLAIVKLLSAVGITNVAENGRRDLATNEAILAGKALSDFLNRETDTFWPAQFRALEALGSVRQATDRPVQGKAEFAATAMSFLVNPKTPPDVRAWAGWALGMMEIPPSVKNYNFRLVSQSLAQAAADIGTKVVAVPDAEKSRIVRQRLTSQLVQLALAFSGEANVRNSGLVHSKHPDAASALPTVGEFEKRVRAVTAASLDLSSAAGVNIKKSREDLVSALDDLKSFLAKPLPGGRTLYAGGPTIPEIAPPKVASGARR